MGNSLTTYCPTIPGMKKQSSEAPKSGNEKSLKECVSSRSIDSSMSSRNEVKDNTKSRKVKEKKPVSNPAYYKLPIGQCSERSLPRLKANKREESSDNDQDDQVSLNEKSRKTSTPSSTERNVEFKSIKGDKLKSQKLGKDWVGLPNEEAKIVAEKALQKSFASPDPTFVHATPVTSVLKEKICKDDILIDDLDYILNDNQTVYEIPSHSVGLRMIKNRTTRSKVDPWRRHGPLVKLCEIGGCMPDSKRHEKNKQFRVISRGTKPPEPPKGKPLTSIKDYMTFKN